MKLSERIVEAMLDEHCGQCASDVDKKQLSMGRKVEREHTDSPKRAERIAIDHLTEPDVEGGPKPGPKHKKYYTNLKKAGLANELVGESDDGPCPHCHPSLEGRRAELEQLGWRQSGWASNARWTNIPGTYEVFDEIIDQLPENEWRYIVKATNARTPEDVDEPAPPSKTLGDYERERMGGSVPKADIMPGGSLGTVGGTSNSGASGIGGGL